MMVILQDASYRLVQATPSSTRTACGECCAWVDRDLCDQLFRVCDPWGEMVFKRVRHAG